MVAPLRASELLQEARDKIADPKHWTTGTNARRADDEPTPVGELDVKWCGSGALLRARHDLTYDHRTSAREIMNANVRAASYLRAVAVRMMANTSLIYTSVIYVNDVLGHEKTLEMYDMAIADAKAHND